MEPFLILSSTDRINRNIHITDHQFIILPNSCNTITYLDLSQFVNIEQIDIRDSSFANVQTLILYGMKNLKSVVIGRGVWNKVTNDFILEDLSLLESIMIEKNSLQNVNSFIIRNNTKLKTIAVKNGDITNGALLNVKTVEISSM